MADITGKHALFNAKLIISGNDLSAFTKSVDQDMSIDSVEVTAMGNFNHQFTPGLGNSALSGELFQDYTATTGIDAIISDLVLNRTVFTAIAQPDNTNPGTGTAVPDAANPAYSNTYFVSKWKGISGSVGAAHSVPFELSPTGDLQRLTA